MDILARLHDDHDVLDAAVAHFETVLNQGPEAASIALELALDHLLKRLPMHIGFEEVHFYAPLKATVPEKQELVALLSGEHEDLLETLDQLNQLRYRRSTPDREAFRTYAFHFIELYRDHTQREHRWLFPMLEQLPLSSTTPSFRGCVQSERITKETTLNAVVRQFPRLRHVLHAFHLDQSRFGTETLEEVAWQRGLEVNALIDELNRSLA